METNINYTLVGAFVVSLVAALVFAVIWLSSGFSFQHYSTYMIYMKESISGLNIDSPVEFNGVDVGAVSSVQLNHKDPQLVELVISIKSNTPVTQGTTATLTSRGVTGISFISLKDKSDDLRPLVILDGQSYPVIKSTPSLFMRIDTALNQLSTNIHEVTQAVKSVLDNENQIAIRNILNNMQQVTNTLAQNSERLTTIIDNTAKVSGNFGPLVQSSLGTMKTLESQTLPATYHLLANLNEATRNVAQLTAALKQNPSMLIRGAGRPALGPGESAS